MWILLVLFLDKMMKIRKKPEEGSGTRLKREINLFNISWGELFNVSSKNLSPIKNEFGFVASFQMRVNSMPSYVKLAFRINTDSAQSILSLKP